MSESFSSLAQIEPLPQNVIKGLQKIQSEQGYLSQEALDACCDHFGVAPAEVEGVVSFYAQFKRIRPGKYRISVCDGTACHIKGAPLIVDWIASELGINCGQTDEVGLFSMETVACLGCCSLAPVMAINGQVYGNLDRKQTLRILKRLRREG